MSGKKKILIKIFFRKFKIQIVNDCKDGSCGDDEEGDIKWRYAKK